MFYSDRHYTKIVVIWSISISCPNRKEVGEFVYVLHFSSWPHHQTLWWCEVDFWNHLCGEKSLPCCLRTCTYISHVLKKLYREDIFYTCPSSDTFTSDILYTSKFTMLFFIEIYIWILSKSHSFWAKSIREKHTLIYENDWKFEYFFKSSINSGAYFF